MKTKIIISTVFAILISIGSAFSHGTCRTRSQCSWSVNDAYKYKAHARVTYLGYPRTATDRDCPVNDGGSGNGYAYAAKSNKCAVQSAKNYWGRYTFAGSVSKRRCARGSSSSQLFYDMSSNFDENFDGYEESEIQTSITNFKEDRITIDSINGFLKVKGNEMFSSFDVKIWLPSDNYDTTMTEEKTFYSMKVELINGGINYTDGLNKNAFELIEITNGEFILKIKNLSIEAMLPKNINGLEDIIEVVVTSDGGSREESVITSISEESTKNISVKLSPNPTNGIVKINFNDDFSKESINIKIYSINGKLISNLAENKAFQNDMSFDLNTIGIEKGIYFILIQNDSKNILKKIVFE